MRLKTLQLWAANDGGYICQIETAGGGFKHVIGDFFELCSNSFSRFVLSASR